MNYDFKEIEAKWQKYWKENQTFKASSPGEGNSKPKYYVLDMFPYPSGAGLHVGHPLGYIASDIYARYKRHKGFNVLHPMGYDSFGLPAEQYAIQTGQHPAITTETNIKRYREQLDKIGFSFDWSREVRTSDPQYYKWTQWIFIQLFNSWYNKDTDKAEDISKLTAIFEGEGNIGVQAVCDTDVPQFTAEEWKGFSSKRQQEILLQYRLTYLAEIEVNWCPALGTVLANDEIVNGVSERGGHPVIRKKMTQWSMRISAYAQRLLDGLEQLDWPRPLKDSQTNWIGRSEGAMVKFKVLSEKVPSPWERGFRGEVNAPTDLPSSQSGVHGEVDPQTDLPSSQSGAHGEIDPQTDLPSSQSGAHGEVNAQADLPGSQSGVHGEVNREGLGEVSLQRDPGKNIEVFTTRPDTIFGVSFMVLAPEHELVSQITTAEQRAEVEAYIKTTAMRSERDRMADVKTITGAFTGAYAEHPFTKKPIPIWIGDYVLAGYGTGAVMSVPCGDQRDYDFATHFELPIPNIFEGVDISKEAFADKENTIIANSDFLNGLNYKEATKKAIAELEKLGQGEGRINYRLRDAVFSRQRYWGEPFPVYYVDGMPQMIEEKYLPIKLPEVQKYLPTETGEPPLGNATIWAWDIDKSEVVDTGSIDHITVFPLELNTMPGWAGSSFYFNRYMDPHNTEEVFSQKAINYWQDVDLYIGGSEHATGHLLYSRFWQKFLFDKGLVPNPEYAKKLINQGMITGTSAFVNRIKPYIVGTPFGVNNFEDFPFEIFISNGLLADGEFNTEDNDERKYNAIRIVKDWLDDSGWNEKKSTGIIMFNIQPIHSDVSFVNSSDELDIEAFKNWRPEYKDAVFILDNGDIYDADSSPSGRPGGVFIVSREVEKMSKSKYNVVNPDEICEEYGADSLRLYEMFLGPLEQSKPWNTAGITGVFGFLKKLWKLYHSGPNGEFHVLDSPSLVGPPDRVRAGGGGEVAPEDLAESFKTLHKTIKKVEEDIENFSFNTSVSTFMICVNELSAQKCNHRAILEPLAILVAPYAPHIAEELWEKLGHTESISTAPFPKFEEKYVVESSKAYPISFNGKMRFTLELPLNMDKDAIEAMVLAHEKTRAQLQGRTPKKVIVVPGKIVNIVG